MSCFLLAERERALVLEPRAEPHHSSGRQRQGCGGHTSTHFQANHGHIWPQPLPVPGTAQGHSHFWRLFWPLGPLGSPWPKPTSPSCSCQSGWAPTYLGARTQWASLSWVERSRRGAWEPGSEVEEGVPRTVHTPKAQYPTTQAGRAGQRADQAEVWPGRQCHPSLCPSYKASREEWPPTAPRNIPR